MATTSPSTAAAGSRRTGSSAQMGALLACAAGVMLFATLAGAYVSVRNSVGIRNGFIPDGLKFDNQAGFMTMLSGLAAAAAAEWALASARLGIRRHAVAGYALAVLFFVGALNAVWFIGQRSGLEADKSAYAVLFYALLAAMVLFIVVGIVTAITNAVRVLGGHIDGANPLLGRAGNWLIHLASAACVAGFFLIYTYK